MLDAHAHLCRNFSLQHSTGTHGSDPFDLGWIKSGTTGVPTVFHIVHPSAICGVVVCVIVDAINLESRLVSVAVSDTPKEKLLKVSKEDSNATATITVILLIFRITAAIVHTIPNSRQLQSMLHKWSHQLAELCGADRHVTREFSGCLVSIETSAGHRATFAEAILNIALDHLEQLVAIRAGVLVGNKTVPIFPETFLNQLRSLDHSFAAVTIIHVPILRNTFGTLTGWLHRANPFFY